MGGLQGGVSSKVEKISHSVCLIAKRFIHRFRLGQPPFAKVRKILVIPKIEQLKSNLDIDLFKMTIFADQLQI